MRLDVPDFGLSSPVHRVMTRRLVSVLPDATVKHACAVMADAHVGCVLVVDGAGLLVGIFTERDVMIRVIARGLDPVRTPIGEVMTARPLALASDTSIAEASELMNERGFRHVPIVTPDGVPVGVASIRDLFRLRLVQAEARLDEELRSLRELRGLLAMDESSRVATLMAVNERLQELALTDELTGLYNYRHFTRRLGEEMARSSRIHAPLSLLVADVDHFKRVNDTLGHPTGDLVLRHVAHILRDAVEGPSVIVRLRKSDFVARYGGEEFAILLMDAPSSGAMVVADRVRQAIESAPCDVPGRGPVSVTVSIGSASAPEHATDGAALVAAADAALYRAKADGRNLVRCAAAPGDDAARG